MAVTNWLNVAGMVCSVSLLISFLVLPIQTTHRHYLTVCLVISVILIQVGQDIICGLLVQKLTQAAEFYRTFGGQSPAMS